MRSRLSGFVSLIAVAIASPLTLGIGVVLYEANSPPERSLVITTMKRLGEGESSRADASRESIARAEYRFQQAGEENKRLTTAYTGLYHAYAAMLQKSLDQEARLIQLQAKNIDQTSLIKKFGANVADLGCFASLFSEDHDLSAACGAGDAIRKDIVGQYQEILPAARPRIVAEMMKDIPKPEELLDPEFKRVSNEFSFFTRNQ